MAINYTRRKDDIDKKTTVEFSTADDMVLPGMASNDARPMEQEEQQKMEIPGEVVDPLPDIPPTDPKPERKYRYWNPRRIAIAIIVCIGVLAACILIDCSRSSSEEQASEVAESVSR